MRKRIFISDLHLEDVQDNRFLRFRECVGVECRWCDELYILGDLVEMWIGDDDNSELTAGIRQVLADAAKYCAVFIMHGNRDFLLGKQFADNCGATLLSEPHVTPDQVLLCHGDSLCTDDHEYQRLRQTLRSRAWQQDILAKPLAERQLLGQQMRAQSRTSNANKSANIMDVNETAATRLLSAQHCHTLIHGHTHRPGVHKVPSTGAATSSIANGGYRRLVMGAWERCGWLCRQSAEQLQLECFSLAYHYENGTDHPPG